MPGPGLSKTGLKLDPGEGEIRHVIESTSFSSPTGFPDPPRPPGDPPSPPQGGLKIICIIFQTLLGVSWEVSWVLLEVWEASWA